MKNLIFIIAMISLVVTTGTCLAQTETASQEGLNMPPGKWWRLPDTAEKHGITAVEQQKLDDLYLESRRKMIDLKGALEKEMLDLELLMDNTEFDEKAASEKYREVQNARTELSLERFHFFIEVRKLLGNERYQELKQKYRELRRSRRPGPTPPRDQ